MNSNDVQNNCRNSWTWVGFSQSQNFDPLSEMQNKRTQKANIRGFGLLFLASLVFRWVLTSNRSPDCGWAIVVKTAPWTYFPLQPCGLFGIWGMNFVCREKGGATWLYCGARWWCTLGGGGCSPEMLTQGCWIDLVFDSLALQCVLMQVIPANSASVVQ